MSNNPNNPCFWKPNDEACREFGSLDLAQEAGLYTSGQISTAQATFAGIALFQTLTQVFTMFRYRSQDWSGTSTDSFYKDWTTAPLNTINFWQISNMIYSWGKIAIYGTAFIF